MRYHCNMAGGEFDRDLVNELSSKYKLNRGLVELLYARGINTKAKMHRFMQPAYENFYDPFLLSGMREAVDRIELAVQNGETVVIYGDYDADGVCATAELYLYLTKRGLTVNCYIPERAKGYGLSEEAVEFIMEEFAPDLVITVDCGISNAAEIEYIYDLGSEVIVTDHHQIGEKIPECTVVNPWLSGQEYPFSNLCGAGVVLKLIQALDPEAVDDYVDIAALATVADSVPLIDENRDIVALGLKNLNEFPRECFVAYTACRGMTEPLTAMDIAFYLAPCINAAGRFDQAAHAFEFLVSDNAEICSALCRELLELNEERKRQCAEATQRVTAKIAARKQFTDRFISVVDNDIRHGIVGIVASKLMEAYHRPTFVFSKDEDILKGSARGISGINLFEMLSSMKELFISFGGHAQAAGITIAEENYKTFLQRSREYLAKIDGSVFLSSACYDMELTDDFATVEFIREIDRLEPFGFGFEKPVFKLTSNRLRFGSLAKNPKYIKIATPLPTFSPMCFTGDTYADILDSDFDKTLLFQLQINRYRSIECVSAHLKTVAFDFDESRIDDETARTHYIEQLYYPMSGPKDSHLQLESKKFIAALDEALNSIYGTLVICNTREGYRYFKREIQPKLKNAANLLHTDYVKPAGEISQNCVLVAAGANLDYANFTEVFFVEPILNPHFASGIVEKFETNVTALLNAPVTYTFIKNLDLDRSCFAKYYRMVKTVDTEGMVALDYYRWYRIFKDLNFDIDLPQFITCMFVFNDLGIYRLDKTTGKLLYDPARSGDITQSKFYQRVKAVQDSL